MKRALRRGLPVVGIGAVLIVAGVLLATRPWSTEQAAGGTIQYRACDFVMEVPEAQGKGAVRVVPVLQPGVEPSLEMTVLGEPNVFLAIDPTSDTVAEAVDVPVPDARFQPILDTLRKEPLDPNTAPWPYTNTVQRPPIFHEKGMFRYQLPDPGSGLMVQRTYVTPTDGSIVHIVALTGCRSVMEKVLVFRRGEEPEVTVLTEDVHPDDEAAFQTFFEEATIHAPEGPR
jgi:hypothetical protein